MTTQAMRQLHEQAANVDHQSSPKCASCMFGKQTNCARPGKQTSVVTEQEGILPAKTPHPGQSVSVDDFVCSAQGRKFEGQGVSNRKPNARLISKDNFLVEDAFLWMPHQVTSK